MASMALYSSNQPENLMGNTTCYLVSSATNINSSPLTYSSSTSTTTHSPPSLAGAQQQQRIAPKLPIHQQQQQQHHHKYLSQQDSSDLMRCKRRIQLGQLPSSGKSMSPQPAAVARRNERERNRVRLVNLGFAQLRQHVPSTTKNKKMSKVDTLKSAVEYIKRLQELLGESQPGSVDENSYPMGGQSSTGSPTPSLCSDASSPYEVIHGDEEDELMDFASWF